MSCHISPLKNNSKNSRKSPHPISHFSIENNFKNSRKISYNSQRVINGEFSQHVSIPHHISPLKNNSKNLEKYICPN
jgi:hypothetical protein